MPVTSPVTISSKDCEGFGSTESDKTRDAKLMSLCMLSLGKKC